MTEITLACLATFGVAALVSDYDGPFKIFCTLRRSFKVFNCTVCTASWLAAPFVFMAVFLPIEFVASYAVIGAVIIIERLT